MKYTICPNCGAHLDFGETCDCKQGNEESRSAAGTKGGEQLGGHTTAASGALPRREDRAVRVG